MWARCACCPSPTTATPSWSGSTATRWIGCFWRSRRKARQQAGKPRSRRPAGLEEETGYHAEELIPLGLFYPACAYSDETIWMYLAKGLTRGERHLDADEFLDVELIPLKDLVAEVMAGNIPDAKTQIAILKAAVHEGVLAGRD